jgi:hypothetical protein
MIIRVTVSHLANKAIKMKNTKINRYRNRNSIDRTSKQKSGEILGRIRRIEDTSSSWQSTAIYSALRNRREDSQESI